MFHCVYSSIICFSVCWKFVTFHFNICRMRLVFIVSFVFGLHHFLHIISFYFLLSQTQNIHSRHNVTPKFISFVFVSVRLATPIKLVFKSSCLHFIHFYYLQVCSFVYFASPLCVRRLLSLNLKFILIFNFVQSNTIRLKFSSVNKRNSVCDWQ